jgi:hypothetical protein
MTLGAQWSGDRRPETKLGGPSVQTPLARGQRWPEGLSHTASPKAPESIRTGYANRLRRYCDTTSAHQT